MDGDAVAGGWVECFCEGCLAGEGEAPLPAAPAPAACCFVPVYPYYGYVPQKGATKQQERVEGAVHKYLVRVGQLPAPLPHIEAASECNEIVSSMGPHVPQVLPQVGFLGRSGLVRELRAAAARATHILLVLRGHGAGAGALVLCDGTTLRPSDVLGALQGFAGSLVCVFNMCSADASSEGFGVGWDGAPFRWATLHSCGAGELQDGGHGQLVTKLLAALLRRPAAERLDQDVVQSVWEQLCRAAAVPGDLSGAMRLAPQLRTSRHLQAAPAGMAGWLGMGA